jgi:hypothetical protein
MKTFGFGHIQNYVLLQNMARLLCTIKDGLGCREWELLEQNVDGKVHISVSWFVDLLRRLCSLFFVLLDLLMYVWCLQHPSVLSYDELAAQTKEISYAAKFRILSQSV